MSDFHKKQMMNRSFYWVSYCKFHNNGTSKKKISKFIVPNSGVAGFVIIHCHMVPLASLQVQVDSLGLP